MSRWQIECRSRQHELHKSKILLRHESHLAGKKNKKGSKLWHPEPPSQYKASPHYVTLRKQEGSHAARHQHQICQTPCQTCLGDIRQTNRWANEQHTVFPRPLLGWTSIAPWTDWPPAPLEKKLNNKQGTEKECTAKGAGCTKCTGEEGRGRELISMQTFSKQRLERQKGWQRAGDKMLPEIGQVVVHKTHLMSQWATSKVKWCCKIEKQSA
jgi:hypothetical protein